MQTAIIWQHGNAAWLPGPDKFEEAATSINNRGQIVGKSWGSSNGKAWIWQSGRTYWSAVRLSPAGMGLLPW